MARRLLWGLIPLGLEFNEELIYGRRGTSLLEDRDANGSGRDGCIEADDMGFVKCSFFLPTVQWLYKEISVKVLKWAKTFRSVLSKAKSQTEPGCRDRGRHLWEPVCLLGLAV